MKMTAKSLYVRVLKEIKYFYKTSNLILNVINSPFLIGFFITLNRCLPKRFNYEFLISVNDYLNIVNEEMSYKILLFNINSNEKLNKVKKLIKDYGLIWRSGLPIIKDLDEKFIIYGKNLYLTINNDGLVAWTNNLDWYYTNKEKNKYKYEIITLDECEQRLKNIRDKINSNLNKLLKDNYKYYLSYYKDTVINDYKKYYN